MTKYLVTGSAGFIGSKVVELLLDRDDEVVGVDNLNDAYDTRLKNWRLAQLVGKRGFTFHRLDICDREALHRVFSPKLGAVINLAARAGVRQSLQNPWDYFETNLTGTLNLLEACREFNVKKFVLASTSSVYGENNPLPFLEDANTDRPLSPYAASKKAAELLCYTYHHSFGMDITVPRFFTVYGPAGRPDMSPFRFVQWIAQGRQVMVYGNGKQSRDFTYVDDIARGTIAALRPVGYEIINLGSDRPTVLMDLIQLIEQKLEEKAKIDYQPVHASDVLATWADIGKAKKLLEWQPQTFLPEGVQSLVEWYQENVSWAREIETI